MNPWTILPFLLLVISILLIIIWFTPVKTGTIVVTYWFGKFNRVLQPGPHLVYWPFETMEVISTATRQIELPDEEQNIDRTSENPPPGKTKPIRVTHPGFREAFFFVKKSWKPGSPDEPFDPDETDLTKLKLVRFDQLPEEIRQGIEIDLVNSPLQGEFSIAVEWDLKKDDEKAIEDHVSNVNTREGLTRDQEIRKRMADQADSILQLYLRRITHGHARLMKRLFDSLIHYELEVLVGEKPNPRPGAIDRTWGIHIGVAYIKDPYAGHAIAIAQSDAAASVGRAQSTIRDSEAAKQAAINKADGDAYALELEGKGEAARIKAVTEVMSDPHAQFVAMLEAAENILPKAQFLVMPSEMGLLAGMGKIIHGVTRERTETPQPPEATPKK